MFETMVDGKPVRSPDHPATVMPSVPGPVKFDVRRSKGFEGMAASPDGKFLYPLLEGPLLTADGKPESKEGTAYLRILEFDVDKGAYTGKSWKYALEAPTNSIGDFNLIDAQSGLIIERDDSEGDPRWPAPPVRPSPTASTCRPSSSASTRSTSARPTATGSSRRWATST